MTKPMRVQQRIRQLQRADLNHAEIARQLRVSRTTVVKYAGKED
jgi:orotate phosphoribosyltransferase-like protein